MTPITKNEQVADMKDLVVLTDSGEYADTDLILCASTDAPTIAIAQYQAQFVKYGEMVYQFEKPEELGQAIVALDAESTHDAAQLWREEEARRIAREQGTLTPADQSPAPDAVVPPEPEAEPQPEEEVEFLKDPPAQNATSTPPTSDQPSEPEMPVIDVTDPPEVLGTTTPDLPPVDPDPLPPPITEPDIVPIPEPEVISNTSTTTPE